MRSGLAACALCSLVATAACRPRAESVVGPPIGRTAYDAPPLPAAPGPVALDPGGDPGSDPGRDPGDQGVAVTLVGVRIHPTIMSSCGLPRPRTFFELDSATLHPEAAPLLDALATCLLGGALRGRELVLVGHADPRGPTAYNWALALERGQSVREALAARGLPQRRVEVLSRGEEDATPWDPQSYQFERRVDVFLAE